MITSNLPEAWNLMDRGIDRESGHEMCHVRRITFDGQKRATVWRLVKRTSRNGIVGWYNVGQFLPNFNGFRPAPERHGKKLSNSRTDLTLIDFAEQGYSTR